MSLFVFISIQNIGRSIPLRNLGKCLSQYSMFCLKVKIIKFSYVYVIGSLRDSSLGIVCSIQEYTVINSTPHTPRIF